MQTTEKKKTKNAIALNTTLNFGYQMINQRENPAWFICDKRFAIFKTPRYTD